MRYNTGSQRLITTDVSFLSAYPSLMEFTKHPFFRGFRKAELENLKRVTEVETFQAEDIIFEEGHPSKELYLVLEGEVAFVKKLDNGKEQIISRAEPGDIFGEVGLFTGEPRSLAAVAYNQSSVAIVPKGALLDFIKNTPGPVDLILQGIVGHLHHTTRHYIEDMLKTEKMAVVGAMMNTIIHDFKNPFTLISLGAQVIMQRHSDERTQQICRNIEEQVRRMVDMANEIADYSRGQQSLEFTPINLKKLFQRFKDLNYPFFQKDDIEFNLEIEDVTIEAEENKLIRVLQNLTSNAIDSFEDRGGVVTIIARRKNDGAEIIIRDNGVGVPEQIRDKIFEPFVTFGKSGGTGLGTAIVKSIIDAHRGTIRFETSIRNGTTFFIWLPKHQPLNVPKRG